MRLLVSFLGLMFLSGPSVAQDIGPSPLSEARFRVLVQVALSADHVTPVNDRLANPLGLTSRGVPFLTRQYSVTGDDTGILHVCAVHDPSADTLLFVRRSSTPSLVLLWATDARGHMTAAARVENGVLTVVPLSDARASFTAEMTLWADPATPLQQPNRSSG